MVKYAPHEVLRPERNKSMKKLSKKEQEFCRAYLYHRNVGKAARLAGYTIIPEAFGIRLLADKRISAELTRMEKELSVTRDEALAGYRRLAFGEIADAVKLILAADKGETIEPGALDLFMVSEIKKPKGGGMEIKFFDRQKALERIEAMTDRVDTQQAIPFYRALENSAKSVFSDGGENR